MKITEEIIEKINKDVNLYDHREGIFFQPFGIPVHIKEKVIYMSHVYAGYSGGTCWGDEPTYFQNNEPEFKIIDKLLNELCPDVKFSCNFYKKLLESFHTNEETHYEYYGNFDWVAISYMTVSEFENILKEEINK